MVLCHECEGTQETTINIKTQACNVLIDKTIPEVQLSSVLSGKYPFYKGVCIQKFRD
jgi:hypothetical protein